jgi:septation ring formation regulator EzrA
MTTVDLPSPNTEQETSFIQGNMHESQQNDKNLDMVRNILFGEQAKASEKKYASLERFIRSSVNHLSEETRKQFDVFSKEIQVIKDLLAEETRARRSDTNAAQLQFESIDKRIESLNKQTLTAQENIHGRIHTEVEHLSEKIDNWQEDISLQLEIATEQLHNAKTDRKTLAALLSSMAKQLHDDDSAKTSAPVSDTPSKPVIKTADSTTAEPESGT